MSRIKTYLAPYDLWIGAYWNKRRRRLYLCLLPMWVIEIDLWPRCVDCGAPVMLYPFGPRKGQPARRCESCMLSALFALLAEVDDEEDGDDMAR